MRLGETGRPNSIGGQGWEVNGYPTKKIQKKYHFIWPKDGKNGTRWGRMKDVLTGKGPDIHVTVSANKMDYMHHRPRRDYWSLHFNLNPRGPDCSIPSPDETIDRCREGSNMKYDFYTRRFGEPHSYMWTDVKWQEKPWKKERYPEAFRDTNGVWWQDSWFVNPPI